MIKKTLNVATELPISLGLVKAALRIDHDDEDAYLTQLIKAATTLVETQIRKTLLKTKYSVTYETPFAVGLRGTDYDPDNIKEKVILPNRPILNVISAKQIDCDGNEHTFTDFEHNIDSDIIFWKTAPVYSYIQFIYEAGYTSADNVPAIYKEAVLLIVQKRYEDRTGSIADLQESVDQLLQGQKSYIVLG